jgi:PilZ domain
MNDGDQESGATRPPRQRTLLKGSLRTEGRAEAIEIRIRNLSSGGLMASCAGAPKRGERVTVGLRGIGDVPGEVAWSSADDLGIAFDRPIDPRRALKPVRTKQPSRFIPDVDRCSRRPGFKVR